MMAKDAKRAATLVEARNGIAGLRKAANLSGKPANYDRWACLITVSAESHSGGSPVAEIEIDLATARKLLPHIENVIGDELTAMGIEE